MQKNFLLDGKLLQLSAISCQLSVFFKPVGLTPSRPPLLGRAGEAMSASPPPVPRSRGERGRLCRPHLLPYPAHGESGEGIGFAELALLGLGRGRKKDGLGISFADP